jgi:hypothetical protein
MSRSFAAAAEPQICVITPAYNSAATLPQTIQSLRAQTMRAWRNIIVDDGSQDATLALAHACAARDPRVAVLSQANAGPAAARNAGLAQVDAEWVHFLDADDWLSPSFYARALECAARNRGADVILIGYASVAEGGVHVARHWPPDVSDARAVFARSCPHAPIGIIARTSVIRELGGFDPRFTGSEDWELWQRLAIAGVRFAADPAPRAYYRCLQGSLSRKTARLMRDAGPLITRGHAFDAADALDAAAAHDSLAGFTVHTAAVACGGGAAPAESLNAGPELDGWSFDPASWADRVLDALAYGRVCDRRALTADKARLDADIGRLVASLAARGADHRQLSTLELHMRARAGGPSVFAGSGVRIGPVVARAFDVTERRPDVALDGADHLVAALHVGGHLLDSIDVAAPDSGVAGADLDALIAAAALRWPPRPTIAALGAIRWPQIALDVAAAFLHTPGATPKRRLDGAMRSAVAKAISDAAPELRGSAPYGGVLLARGEAPFRAPVRGALEREGWRILALEDWLAVMAGRAKIDGRPLLIAARDAIGLSPGRDAVIVEPKAARLAPAQALVELTRLRHATPASNAALIFAPGAWTASLAQIARAAGFALGIDVQHGFARPGGDPMRTPCIRAHAGEAPELIAARLRPAIG